MNKNIRKLTAFLTGTVTMLSCVSGYGFNAKEAKNMASAASGSVLAFPGAVGGGRYATGGRGGEVYHVTNLNDSGTGSFRDAVSKSNRIVVFDVSGTIELKSNILCQSNVTIAGQTAPGGSGITLKNYKMGMSGNNIICRYISSRPGPYAATSSGNDAWGGDKGSSSIIDHCSMSWTTDEQWGLYSNNEYYTVQYSIIGPADSWGGHKKGLHGFGLMMGKGYSTFDHNLIIHNVSRNFRGKVEGTETADFTNNVIYNWAYQTAYGTIGHLNYVNNTLKMGNGTTGGKHYVSVDSSTKPQNFRIFLKGNRMLNKDSSIYDDVTSDNWNGITVKQSITDTYGVTKDTLKSDTSFQTIVNGENVSTADTCESAEASYEHVISFAGNGIAPDKRTAVDKQCAEETRTGTGNMSGTASYDEATDTNKENIDKYHIECGVTYTYPEAVTQKTITDTDNDGMDDNWELARGLDPSDPSDTNGDYCGLGYTNIEYYINDLTVDSFPEGVVTLSPEDSVEPISAFETIQAEDFDSQEGVRAEDNASGGQNIGFIENGDWIMFRKVDFEDGAKSIKLNISGNTAGIELYLDRMDGTPAARISFAGTSGFSDYQELEYNIPTITGTHSLYLKFTGGDGYLLNADSFVFGKDSLPMNGRLVKNLNIMDESYAQSWGISDNAAVGSPIFGDRDVVYAQLPDELSGSESILTACDSKYSTGVLAQFTAETDVEVYVGLDARVTAVPQWLSAWEKTGLTAANSANVTFNLYKTTLSAGEIIELGENGQSSGCVNYIALVKEKSGVAPIVYGDANCSGEVDMDDVIAILCHSANPNESTLTAEGKNNADVYQRGDGISSNDAVSVQKFLVLMIDSLPES